MRLVILTALLAATASRPGCGTDANGYDPCAGKACGASCTDCPPGDPSCAETAVLKECDASGRCVPLTLGLACSTAHPDCVGKVCGASCNPCGPDRVCPTLIPSACDRFGQCVGDVPGICEGECLGKACGTPCHPPSCPFAMRCLEPGYCTADERCVATGAGPVCPP